ncbi:MAG: polysaccharide deacetylase [Candidatus Berkelbacteria bacterium Licking1014_7]|uniref:Polysaccharide deacetylase n=1 Tax=Candidatus Berkelbacteria bacterium Licking1014_7 TaxID=2017147 RepID=A0A554LJU1_9BACT|nr:MAG: polysaccharide deacetylase [Candidatus Berkelbacteria bacterium Licking1014_7]
MKIGERGAFLQMKDENILQGCVIFFSGILSCSILLIIFLIWFNPQYVKNTAQKAREAPVEILKQLTFVRERGNNFQNINEKNPAAILMYHYVRNVDKNIDPTGFSLSVSPTDFRAQIDYLSQNYNIIDFGDFTRGNIPDRAVILTFDDGYQDFYDNVLPVLREYKAPATIYIITEKIGQSGYLSAREILLLSKTNLITIGSHTVSHPNLSTANISNQIREISESRKTLEKITGQKIENVSFPSGKYNDETWQILKTYRFKTAVTIQEGLAYKTKNLFELPRVRVSGSMSLDGLKQKLDDFFQNSQTGGSGAGV